METLSIMDESFLPKIIQVKASEQFVTHLLLRKNQAAKIVHASMPSRPGMQQPSIKLTRVKPPHVQITKKAYNSFFGEMCLFHKTGPQCGHNKKSLLQQHVAVHTALDLFFFFFFKQILYVALYLSFKGKQHFQRETGFFLFLLISKKEILKTIFMPTVAWWHS